MKAKFKQREWHFGQTCCLAACLAASPHPWTSGMEHLRQNRSRQNLQVALRVWTPTLQPSPRHTWNNSVPLIPSFSLSKIFSILCLFEWSSPAAHLCLPLLSLPDFSSLIFHRTLKTGAEAPLWVCCIEACAIRCCLLGPPSDRLSSRSLSLRLYFTKGTGFLYIHSYKQKIRIHRVFI